MFGKTGGKNEQIQKSRCGSSGRRDERFARSVRQQRGRQCINGIGQRGSIRQHDNGGSGGCDNEGIRLFGWKDRCQRMVQ